MPDAATLADRSQTATTSAASAAATTLAQAPSQVASQGASQVTASLETAPATGRLRHVLDATSDAARRGLERVRETGTAVRTSAADARDATRDYVREQPFKSLLIAAAAGATLAGAAMLARRMWRR